MGMGKSGEVEVSPPWSCCPVNALSQFAIVFGILDFSNAVLSPTVSLGGSASQLAMTETQSHVQEQHAAGLAELRNDSMLLLRLDVPFRLLPWRKLGRRIRNLLVRDAAEYVRNAVQAGTFFVV